MDTVFDIDSHHFFYDGFYDSLAAAWSIVGLSKLFQNDIRIFALKKTHRFEPFEYLYLSIMSITGGQTNTTRHNYLYRSCRDTIPRFQFLSKLSEVRAINDTDRPRVESRRGCLVGVPDIMACSFGRPFLRCALILLLLEWQVNRSLHTLHTTLSRGSPFLLSTDQNLKCFQTGLLRLLGVQTTLSAAELGSELFCHFVFLPAICIRHGFLSRLTFSSERRRASAAPAQFLLKVTCRGQPENLDDAHL